MPSISPPISSTAASALPTADPSHAVAGSATPSPAASPEISDEAPSSSPLLTVVTSTITSILTDDRGTPIDTLTATTTFTTLASAVPADRSSEASILTPGTLIQASVVSPTSTSQASSSPVSNTKDSSKLSSGAAAGLGIGAAAAGAIIALVAIFLIFRCRNRRKRQRLGHGSQIALTRSQSDFHPAYAPLPPPAVSIEKSEVAALGTDTPTATPPVDQAIFASWSTIQDRIRKHVQDFYHSGETQLGAVPMESFERLGYTGIQPSGLELLDRLRHPNYRVDVLMYVISWSIVQRINFRGSRWNTLLPPECVESMKAMSESLPSASLTNWRTSTARLLQKTYLNSEFTRDDPRTANIEAALKALMPIFKPFVLEETATACFEDLEDILEAAARFGFALFSSPSLYEFDWHESHWYERGELTPLPDLRRVDDATTPGIDATF